MKNKLFSAIAALAALTVLLASLVTPLAHADEPSEESAGAGILVRYALLLGTVDKSLPPPKSPHLAVDGVLNWDSQRDNEELKKLLGLKVIHTLQQSSVLLDRDRGEVDLATTVGEQRIEVDISLEVFRPDETGDPPSPYATLWLEVRSDGELVTAPTISSRLGERAIVSTAASDKTWILFFVVEVHDQESMPEASTRP